MFCISHRKNLQQLTSIKVPNISVGQNWPVSYSAKERHSTVEYIVGWHEHFNPFRWKKKVCVEPQGRQGFLGCQLKQCLAMLHGKGELIPVGGKASRRATSQGTGKWLSASSPSNYWHPVRNVSCYWDCWNGKKFECRSFLNLLKAPQALFFHHPAELLK